MHIYPPIGARTYWCTKALYIITRLIALINQPIGLHAWCNPPMLYAYRWVLPNDLNNINPPLPVLVLVCMLGASSKTFIYAYNHYI